MKIKLKRVDIVILANAHNPSIISPQWLKEKNLIMEKPKHFVYTPEISLFESETFSLIVDRQRLQITAKKQDINTLKNLGDIGKGYVKLLPHIPYKSMGLNFEWLAEGNENERLPNINVVIDSMSNLSTIFSEHELRYGGIIYAAKKPYLLKLIINPQDSKSLVYNFNYHHEVKGLNINVVMKYIGNLVTLYRHSEGIVKKLCRGE